MPKMSGLELFKVVKKDADLQDISFIMLTSSSENDKVKEALQAGVTDYIIKPYTTDVLLKNVMNRLG
jgi:two-component system chemotaxis response regulator CheY